MRDQENRGGGRMRRNSWADWEPHVPPCQAQNHTSLGPSSTLGRGCWEKISSCDYVNVLTFQLPEYSRSFLPHTLLSFKPSSLWGNRSLRKTFKKDFLLSFSPPSLCPRKEYLSYGAQGGHHGQERARLCLYIPLSEDPKDLQSPQPCRGLSSPCRGLGAGEGAVPGWSQRLDAGLWMEEPGGYIHTDIDHNADVFFFFPFLYNFNYLPTLRNTLLQHHS